MLETAPPQGAAEEGATAHAPASVHSLTVAALGVVYGDIGTSPLYAIKLCFPDPSTVVASRIFGVLSLIVWSLTIVVTVKYVIVLMRADNRGEGGIFALTVLALRATAQRHHRWILVLGMIGGSLFFGDAVLTPAISVISAVEGLEVRAPELRPYVLPLTLGLLIALFVVQRRGTGRVGRFFGPVIILWFATLGTLGLVEIARNPTILTALNPLYGIELIMSDPGVGFILLGSVVLAVTGAEALYADMGHFGRVPVRRAWLYFVFPALLLNYFGQGALLLADPATVQNPFYRLAPHWAVYPLVILAAAATVIASQAVISGAFSLARQAVQLGYLPRMQVRHTSEETFGQVFLPDLNAILLVAVVATVLAFRSSEALGSAYGIAVTGTMIVDTILGFTYLALGARWPLWGLVPLFLVFATVDVCFFSANLLKIHEGGWFPLTVAVLAFTVMATWWRGRRLIAEQRARDALPLGQFVAALNPERPVRVPGTSIFMTRDLTQVPVALLHALKHTKALHERVVMMQVDTEDAPHVADDHRLEIVEVGKGFFTMRVRYGFMDEPNVMRALAQCRVQHFRVNLMDTSFFIGREKVRARPRRTLFWRWRDRLFILMTNLALDATEFFRIPPNRVVEFGGQIEI
ncbi:MAG TPA: potassium transporter Kup [Stellaceae bacterium]|jgi:KUP system potassium uptake protein|nr:potassium transporter Kup [Stellaceae bacterium]